ncbi:nucleotidyltransferase family protein [Roseofilum sp. Guam]|uniref:nucleotidyltransferase family protein n=1 Tax=Roseofilum sp. Guam TaxID=2821502 RepID=UPI00298D72C4|nr:nucleotidyltransferase family protein [Roseofilum sp. Guam]
MHEKDKTIIVQTDSLKELAEFWDTQDLTDFEDRLEEVTEQIFERSSLGKTGDDPITPLRTKQDLMSSILAHRETIKTYGVRSFGVFGSFQRGEADDESDVDVFVVFEPEQKTFRNFMDLCFFLEDLFGRRINLVTPESLSPHFGNKILQEVEYVCLT